MVFFGTVSIFTLFSLVQLSLFLSKKRERCSPCRIRTDVRRAKACYPWPLDEGAAHNNLPPQHFSFFLVTLQAIGLRCLAKAFAFARSFFFSKEKSCYGEWGAIT